MEAIRKDPIIFVIGCTGTGKSDLGVAIAKKYNGEVISADSMQIYEGLDIATNKITAEEAEGIPHHLMSFVDAATARFNIHQFRQQGLKVVEEIRQRGRIPVVVGGTAYYVESLLFEENIIETPGHLTEDDNMCKSQGFKGDPGDVEELDKLSNTELHRRLEEIDPESARLVHPNNRTRVLRAIEVYRLTVSPSNILSVDSVTLQNREKLINREHFGVLQCIGLKEFIPYLELSAERRLSAEGERLFEKGCEDVKLHTRQYARRQRNWINSRFVRRQEIREVPSLKKLDTSDKNTFIAEGMRIVDEWMAGRDFKERDDGEAENSEDANMTRHCEICGIVVAGTRNWNKHLAGKRHKNLVRAMKRRQQAVEGSAEGVSTDCAAAHGDKLKNDEENGAATVKRPVPVEDSEEAKRSLLTQLDLNLLIGCSS
ncbi:tRNA dimethylallyltransferase [Ancylostoma ceylanicum]|uniref:tRNA dimethylallyltransferase n=1 Tax=Ancylostoma ceylanicum TaxID=53326 RepID=A0A0D6M7X8_9BILA|nr:tRNA dimethylallyltransferase [Ancylostoma ceylanicum]